MTHWTARAAGSRKIALNAGRKKGSIRRIARWIVRNALCVVSSKPGRGRQRNHRTADVRRCSPGQQSSATALAASKRRAVALGHIGIEEREVQQERAVRIGAAEIKPGPHHPNFVANAQAAAAGEQVWALAIAFDIVVVTVVDDHRFTPRVKKALSAIDFGREQQEDLVLRDDAPKRTVARDRGFRDRIRIIDGNAEYREIFDHVAQDPLVALDLLAFPNQGADLLKQDDVDADDAAFDTSDDFLQPRAQALASCKEQVAEILPIGDRTGGKAAVDLVDLLLRESAQGSPA